MLAGSWRVWTGTSKGTGRRLHRSRVLLSPRWTVRRRLVAFVIIAVSPILASAYLLASDSVAQTKAEILVNTLVTARTIEADLSQSIATTNRQLSTLSEQPQVVGGDSAAATHLFEQALALYPELLNIAAADSSGKIFATAVWDTNELSDVSDREYFRHVMLSGWPTVSRTALTSRSSGFPTAVVAVPIKDRSRMQIGVVIGELSLQHLQTSLALGGGAERGDVKLVDGEGTVLSHRDWRFVAESINLAQSPAVQAALRGERGSMEVDDLHAGEQVLVGYVPVVGTSWALMVEYPVSKVYAAVSAAMVRSLLIVLFGVLASSILSFVLLRWISKSFDSLWLRVRRLFLDGRFPGHGEEGDGDELQQLALAFDSLARMLDSRAMQMAVLKSEVDRRSSQLKGLSGKIVHIEEEERRKIALDLHDGVAQLLAIAVLEAQEAEHYLQSDLSVAHQKIHSTLQLMQQASAEVRRDLFELHQPGAKEGDLPTRLGAYLSRCRSALGVDCKLDLSGAPVVLDPAVEAVIMRVVQECLHNVRKHAGATDVLCHLHFTDDSVRLTMEDNGKGFCTDHALHHPSGQLGLLAMKERIQSVGGSIEIHSEPGRGATITLELPQSRLTRSGRRSKSKNTDVCRRLPAVT